MAYIDAYAHADPDWLTYLALALEVPVTASAGGPNPVPQTTRRWTSAWRAPGGPIHELLDDERAEHATRAALGRRRPQERSWLVGLLLEAEVGTREVQEQAAGRRDGPERVVDGEPYVAFPAA